MKKYLLFTADNFEAEYSFFQGDYDTLGQAFRRTWCLAQNSGRLCAYKIILYVDRVPKLRPVAEGFINPEVLIIDLPRAGEVNPSTRFPRPGLLTIQ